MKSTASTLFWCGAVAALLAGAYACGDSSPDTPLFNSGTGGKGGAGGGSNPDGSVGGGSSGTGGFVFDANVGDQSMNPETACAAEKVVAQVLPLDLYLMVDRSGSMDKPISGQSTSKWDNQSAALKSFFAAPESNGLWAALRFFPLDDAPTPQDPQCSGNAYATPLVDWGELPGANGALVQAIDSTTPDGAFTPTQEAIHGMLKGALQRQLAQPLHVVAGVIVSDGTPCCTSCPIESAAQLAAVAASYANPVPPQPPIKTFAIFVDAEASDVMKQIAEQGGTTAPYDATSGQQAFIDALNKIRGSALGCEYKVPEAEAGKVEPELVQVTYTPGGGTAQELKRIKKDGGTCGPEGGWYYDNDEEPTKITLCDATCNTVRADQSGEINILLGCGSTRY